jgi:hypothetical protein
MKASVIYRFSVALPIIGDRAGLIFLIPWRSLP